jgi:hypothetical protein
MMMKKILINVTSNVMYKEVLRKKNAISSERMARETFPDTAGSFLLHDYALCSLFSATPTCILPSRKI